MDEVQRAPELLTYIHVAVDEDDRPGPYGQNTRPNCKYLLQKPFLISIRLELPAWPDLLGKLVPLPVLETGCVVVGRN